MEIINLPADHYLQLIKDNKPFSFSRFGDGEVLCMSNHSTLSENCDGSTFLPQLVEPMKNVFRNKHHYYHCLLDCTFEPAFKQDVEWFKQFLNEVCPDMDFYNGEVWQDLSFNGRIKEFAEAVSCYVPVFVGGSHLQHVIALDGMKDIIHIETPDKDSFLVFDWIKQVILEQYAAGSRMFLFSTGYTTKILIDELFPIIGQDSFLIDIGSALDPYCGRMSRDNMKWQGFSKFQPYTRKKLG